MDRCQKCRCQTRRCHRACLAAAVGMFLLAYTAGCQAPFPFAHSDLGPALPQNANVEQVCQRVNANIERLHAWRSSDLRISGRSLPVHLTGHIAVEGPRNFRLTAGALGMTDEADFGSNADWFWFWVRRGQPNYVFRARHDDMEHSEMLRQAIPFQPDWLIEALGVVPIDPSKVTRLEPGENRQTVNLISELLSPSGQPVQKVTRVDLAHGVVLGHYLYDAGRRLIAKADLAHHSLDNGVIMPHLITLEWPQANMQISLEMGQIEINPTTVPPRIWEVPNKEPLYASCDIGARTRTQMRRDTTGRAGRTRLGDEEPSAVGAQDPSEFDGPRDAASGRLPAGNRAWANANNASDWSQPLESTSSAGDSRPLRPEPRDFAPGQSEPDTALENGRTAQTTAPSRDPFASDDAWPAQQK